MRGDITRESVDAIVNAANTKLLGGGGVDGAIHRAAGPDLLAECRTLGGGPTPGGFPTLGGLPHGRGPDHEGLQAGREARHPCGGPVYRDGGHGEAEKLRGCYVHAMTLAAENGVRSIAFPSISTGVYRYPIDQAAKIAVETVRACLEKPTSVEVVRFVCFSEEDLAVYRRSLEPG